MDRRHQRRILAGELRDRGVSTSTIRNWVMAWQRQGLLGLVDGRKMTKVDGFELIAPEFRAIVQEIVDTLDGDRSSISHKEVIRQAKVRLKQDGKSHVHVPQRASGEYVAWLIKARGRTTRAQRSIALRGASGTTHVAVFRPGQVVAIDATRADVLVWDPLHERAFSVEIITFYPGSRATSRPYAITWLWTHWAGGVLATSLGWPIPPDLITRGYYRRYTRRLPVSARQALLDLVEPPTTQKEDPT